MEILFKGSNQNLELVNWLKQFKDISNSLLIEIDVSEEKKSFIAKSFTIDNGLIKYSEIPFEKCGLELVSVTDGKKKFDVSPYRVKVGIFMILSKFIDVISTFSTTDYTMCVEFDKNEEDEEISFEAQSVLFKSKTLKIKVKTGNISEFSQISDEKFFGAISKIDGTDSEIVSVAVTSETLKNLISISSLLSVDSSKDSMEFYTFYDKEADRWKLQVRDAVGDSYDYYLGDVTDAEKDKDYTTSFKVFRNKIIMGTKGSSTELMNMKLSCFSPDRILLTTDDEKTMTVIAGIRE